MVAAYSDSQGWPESRIHGTVERESGGAVDAAKWRCGKDANSTKGWPKGGLQWTASGAPAL